MQLSLAIPCKPNQAQVGHFKLHVFFFTIKRLSDKGKKYLNTWLYNKIWAKQQYL